MTPERIASIRARLEAATPGPWIHDPREPFNVVLSGDLTRDGYVLATCRKDVERERGGAAWRNDAPTPFVDAAFIAHAPTDIADLLAALAEAEAKIAAVRALPMETYTAAYDLANDVRAALDSAPKAVGDA